jgi:hypothetical protein
LRNDNIQKILGSNLQNENIMSRGLDFNFFFFEPPKKSQPNFSDAWKTSLKSANNHEKQQ